MAVSWAPGQATEPSAALAARTVKQTPSPPASLSPSSVSPTLPSPRNATPAGQLHCLAQVSKAGLLPGGP